MYTAFYWNELKKSQTKEFAGLNSDQDDLRKTTLKGKMLFYAYRTKNLMHYSYSVIFIVRRILVALVLTLLKFYGFYQLVLLSLISGANLVYFTSYQPFQSKLRNVVCTMLEVAYLSICMTIFPYVYPDIDDETFTNQGTVVVGLFLSILLLTLIVAAVLAIKQLSKKSKNHPIFKEPVEEEPVKKDIRDQWTGKPPQKPEEETEGEGDKPADGLIDSVFEDDTKKTLGNGPKINEKGGLETEEDLEDSESSSEEEETESESETDSDLSEDAVMGDAEDYSNLRNIPQADVHIDTGFTTGMSKLREAQIQDYRKKEKQMF